MSSLPSDLLGLTSFLFKPLLQHAWWGLLLISVLAGAVLLIGYGAVSNQLKLRQVKRDVYSNILEAVLFRHDLRTSLKAQGRLFSQGGRYFLIAVPPLLVLALPCIILLGQLNYFFGSAPAAMGEPLLVSIRVDEPDDVYGVELRSEGGSTEVSFPVRIRELGELYYRLTPLSNAAESILIENASGDVMREPLPVEVRGSGFSSQLHRSWVMQWLYPSLATLPAGISSVSFSYEPAYYELFGFPVHWLVFFFLVSLVSGLVTAKVFRIEI